MKTSKAFQHLLDMIKELGRIPTLEEWMSAGKYKRTTYFEMKRMYKMMRSDD